MIVKDDELKKLNSEKQILMREEEQLYRILSGNESDFTSKKIDVTTYKIRKEEYENRININKNRLLQVNELTNKKIQNIIGTVIKTNTEVNKMAEEEKVEEPKRGSKVRANSYSSLIVKYLMKKGVKDAETCAARVLEEKPGRDAASVKSQVNAIIGCVKRAKDKRWSKYTWDAENYLLIEKGQE